MSKGIYQFRLRYQMLVYSNKILILLLLYPFLSWTQSSNSGRIESEFKLSVNDEIKSELWEFLNTEFNTANLQRIDTAFTSTTAKEIFHDQYFDDAEKTLVKNKAGVRFRQRLVNDSLIKALVQLKLPSDDTTGVARIEIKFNPNTKIKHSDRLAIHPFWKHVKPKNRDDVNLHLAEFGLRGKDLHKAIKVKQDRQRIYVSKKGAPFLTMTFDEVCSFYFPYPCFTELELELNEIMYTQADAQTREQMEKINEDIKDKIMTAFPSLAQNQTPKYNKMEALLKNNLLYNIYDKLIYIIFILIICIALFLTVQQFYSKQKLLMHAD